MRSQTDPNFSSLCDRLGRGTITKEDEEFLISRIQPTISEEKNDNFKTGKLSIISKQKEESDQYPEIGRVNTKSKRIQM